MPPTQAEIQSEISKTIKPLEELRKFAGTHVAAGSSVNVGDNYLNMEDTLVQALETSFSSEWTGALQAFRGDLVSAISRAPSMLAPGLREYGIFIAAPEVDIPTIMKRLHTYFSDNGVRVTSRQFVFGSPTFSGATGNGTINRLNKDERNFDIENQHADAKVAECIADEHSGAKKGEEVFLFQGGAPNRDILKVAGSGKTLRIKALSANDSFSFIDNPSFSQLNGSSITSLSSVPGWTVGTAIANFNLDQTNYYRAYDGDTTPAAVKFLTNDSLTQDFNVRKATFNPNLPVYLQIAWNRSVGSCDGTLTLEFGTQSTSVVLAAQSGWQILRMPIGTNQWMRNWNKVNPTVKITLSGRTSGTLLVDDVVIGHYTPFDGSYYAVVGGSTQFLRTDKATWTDTETGSVIQHWIWRGTGFYLPHSTGGGVTWADP